MPAASLRDVRQPKTVLPVPARFRHHRRRMPARFFFITTALLAFCWGADAARFGTVIPVRGQVADIAVDTQRNLLYAANFTANRIEVLSLSNQSLLTPMNVAPQPSAVAISSDNSYLVVGHYNAGNTSSGVGLTIINLNAGTQQVLSLGTDSVLTAAFGSGSKALVVTTSGVGLLDPASGTIKSLQLTTLASTPLQVPWATSPASIISGTAGISGDGSTIYALVAGGAASSIIQYSVTTGSLVLAATNSSPALAPRSISVDQTGTTFLAGWILATFSNAVGFVNLAQFPAPPGILNQGGHVFDPSRNLIYAQVSPGSDLAASSTASAPLLQIFDSDNLTVRETFPLNENLAGRALLSGTNMYAVSDSGITILPMGALSTVHRVKAMQEDLLFQSNGCNQGIITRELDIADPGGNVTDFTLSSSSPGVSFSIRSGTTPASVQVQVDPTQFQDQKGTASVSVQITSSLGVNTPLPVRVLINTRNPDQQGAIYDVPGTVVDVLADPNRDRFYVLRQDQNQILAFDGTSMNPIAVLRTGNTPMQMAISQDQLLVTNDNSQLINVYDLPSLTQQTPIYLPSGFYARSIASANGSILATTRSIAGACPNMAPACLININLASRIANPASSAVYANSIDPNSALSASPSGLSIFMTMPTGTVALYDTGAQLFVASRSDIGALSGAYAALSDNVFLAGNNVFNGALVPVGQVSLLGGVSSGSSFASGKGLLSTTPSGGRSGVIQRFSMDQLASISPARTAEAPDLAATVTRTPLGQTGQTILPFTRTIAPLTNQKFIVQLSTSGFTAIPSTFDAPTQPPAITSVVNAADDTTAIAPGGLITLWGSGLSVGTAAAASLPLANGLNNVCLYANSVAAPLLFVSPNQVNAQLPFGLPTGANLILSNPNGTSAAFTLSSVPTAPAIFRTSAGTPMIIRTVDGQLISDSTPIHLNETLIIYLTGLGTVAPGVTAGVAAPSGPLAVTTTPVSVYIGGSQLFTLWSGLAPGLVGVYQVNALVPFHSVPTGSNIPFTVVQGSAQTTVKVRVEQ